MLDSLSDYIQLYKECVSGEFVSTTRLKRGGRGGGRGRSIEDTYPERYPEKFLKKVP